MTRTRKTLQRLWRAATTDGCTASPDLIFYACCARHDRDYATGTDCLGRPLNRAQADARLLDCMRRTAVRQSVLYRPVPYIYYAAVRLFGGPRWLLDRRKAPRP